MTATATAVVLPLLVLLLGSTEGVWVVVVVCPGAVGFAAGMVAASGTVVMSVVNVAVVEFTPVVAVVLEDGVVDVVVVVVIVVVEDDVVHPDPPQVPQAFFPGPPHTPQTSLD